MATTELTGNLEKAYFDYAVEVITDRALPRLEDGLKPVQRRIIYAMHEAGLRPDKAYRKSARVVGDVLGRYHPHGDSSVYEAMVRMAQDFSLREPLIDGQGNFGSIDGDSAAAMRYTEARLAKVAELMTQDIDRDTVPWQPNFDSSLKEPVILPAVLPNLLINGSSGVAVAMATNLPPHNLGEVCEAMMFVAGRWAKREGITTDQLMKYIPGPDFPTGGVVYRRRENAASAGSGQGEGEPVDAIRQAYETGQGRLTNQARVIVEPGKNGKADIIVTELPYAVKKSTILEKIAKEVREGRITGVSDLRDESDYEGLRVVIEVTRGNDPKEVLESLLKYTNLRQTFGVINRALVADDEGEVSPKLLPLKEILIRFIVHRLTVIERRSRHELTEREARLHIVQGLLKALDIIDQVIDAIRKSKTVDTARENLMKQFEFSEAQARAILSMQLSRLAALERSKLKEEGKELWARIKYLKELLASEEKRLAVVVEETQTIKSGFATPRRTVILDSDGRQAGATEADIQRPTGPQVVVLTTTGVKRLDKAAYSYRVKPGEVTKRATECYLDALTVPSDGQTLLVSSAGRGWQAPLWRLPEQAGFDELGLKKGEFVLSVQPPGLLTLGTRSGVVKRIEPALTEATWAMLIGLDSKDEVLFAGPGPEVIFVSAARVIRFAAETVNPQATPSARGVAGVKVKEDDRLVGGLTFDPAQATHLVIVTEGHFIKRIPLAELPLQGRGGQGLSLGVTKATGPVVAVCLAGKGAKYLDVISIKGRRQRLDLAAVPETARDGRGAGFSAFDADDLPATIVCWA